jgi:hypothetical protein
MDCFENNGRLLLTSGAKAHQVFWGRWHGGSRAVPKINDETPTSSDARHHRRRAQTFRQKTHARLRRLNDLLRHHHGIPADELH